MKEQPAIPVIQHSDLPGITVCRGCGSEENVQAYALRVGDNERYVIGWCNRCARTVATFLLKPEKGTIQKAIDSLKTLLTERGYEMEIEERSEEHTSELQSPDHLVCRLLLEKKKKHTKRATTHTHGQLAHQ